MPVQPGPEQFMIAESVPPKQLVGHRVWVEGFGPGLVLKFEKAWVGFGTSTHRIKFDDGREENVKLRRHGNGKTPFILLDANRARANPAAHAFRYREDGADSGSEPVTPSEGSVEGYLDIPGAARENSHAMDLAPGSLIEHLEHHAWDICARIANPEPGGFASSALSESLSESPSMAFSCTPPECARFNQPMDMTASHESLTAPVDDASISRPMAIPIPGQEPLEVDPNEICRVDHLLSESGTIFTPGDHKWICEASPPQNSLLARMMQGGPPQLSHG